MTKPFICPKCKEPGKRHKARAICDNCAIGPKERPVMPGFNPLSQQYLNRPLRPETA